MSYALKNFGFSVISNDILYSDFCISKAIVENSNKILNLTITPNEMFNFFTQEQYENINWLSNNLYFDDEVKELASIINYSYTLKGYNRFIFLALLRRAMIRKIPYSRMCIKWEEIVKFRDEELSYRKYGRRRAYHNISFLEHIYLNLEQYNNAVFDNGLENYSYNLDCLKMIDKIDKVDLIYIDPPYPSTMNNYFNFYGSYDKIFKKEAKHYTDFTNKNTFLQNLRIIFEKSIGKADYIVISLNNKSKPNYNEIVDSISDLTRNFSFYQKSHAYKVTGKENKKQTDEIMLIFEII